MINPNYNYTNPISSVNTVNIAKGMPFPIENRKPVTEIDDSYNKNRFNQEQNNNYQKVLYSPKLSPSVASSTVAFLKARDLLGPAYMHNEAITRFYNTSMINVTASAQKNRVNLLL